MAQAALVIPVSGPYLGLWNALALGTQQDDGYQLQATFAGQEINATDAYGMTLVEAIWRGQNWRCLFRGLEWNKSGLLSAAQAFGQSGAVGTFTPILANIGDRWSKYGQSLLLTAILGNPPTTPQTLTALSSMLAPNSQTQFNMTSKMREMPLELALLPYSTTIGSVTYNVPFSTT